MRLHAVYHVTGITIFVLYVLFRLSGALRTILESTLPHALSKEELAVIDAVYPEGNGTLIPQIIHQVYLGWDNKEMPLEWKEAQRSCIELHPNYDYMVQYMDR
jgi:inositol phosphorylceramide mannosyltransferase catalytic subunit